MTKEEIVEMKPGEKLDRLVAIEVMGEPEPNFTPDDALVLQLSGTPVTSPKGSWVCLCRYEEDDIPTWRPLPYSAGISAAWPVVNILKYNWDCIDLVWDVGAWDIHLENYMAAKHFYLGKEAGETYEKLPEAICKAALLAKLHL